MTERRAWPYLAITLFLAAIVTVGPVWPDARQTELAISDAGGTVLGTLALEDGRFDYVFVHSIHLTFVEELFRVDEAGRLHLFELRYESSGVGMPADAEGGYRLENGRFILTMDRTFDRIPLFVSIVPGHGITAGGKFHPFTEWAKPEDILVLTAIVH